MTATEAHTVKGRLSVACFTSPGSRKASRLVLQVNVSFGASCLHHITSHKLYANPFFPLLVSFHYDHIGTEETIHTACKDSRGNSNGVLGFMVLQQSC